MLALSQVLGRGIVFSRDNSHKGKGIGLQPMTEAQDVGAHGVDLTERTAALRCFDAVVEHTIPIKDIGLNF